LNGDGIPDLAVSGSGVNIFLGIGDGTFQAAQYYAPGAYLVMGVGDFNGDGFPDLAMSYVWDPAPPHSRPQPDAVTVLLNAADW
jgi:hypothetical protein